MIGDMAAGQWADPFKRRSIQSSSRSRSTDDPRSSQEPKPNLLTLAPPVGLRPPYAASVKRLSHLDCRAFSRRLSRRSCGLAGADGVEIVPPDDVVVWVEAKGAPERLPAGSEEGDAHEHALINRGGAQKIPRGR